MNGRTPTVLPRVIFVAEYVPPGQAYHDEPSELAPAGWWVRLDGFTFDDREGDAWMDYWWINRHFGESARDHLEAVMVANLANEHWSLNGYAPHRAEAALTAALVEMAGA